MLTLRLILAVISTTLLFVSTSSAFWTFDHLKIVDHRIDHHSEGTTIYCSVENTHETEDSHISMVTVSFKKGDQVVFVAVSDEIRFHGPGQIVDFVFGTDFRDISTETDLKPEDYDSYEIYAVGHPVGLHHKVLEYDRKSEKYHDDNGNYVEGEVTLKEGSFKWIQFETGFGYFRQIFTGEVVNNTNAIIHDISIFVDFYDSDGKKTSFIRAASNYNPILGTLIYPGQSLPFIAVDDLSRPASSWTTEIGYRATEIVGFASELSVDMEQDDEGEVPAAVESISWGMIKSTF